jgi:hypothetical protein
MWIIGRGSLVVGRGIDVCALGESALRNVSEYFRVSKRASISAELLGGKGLS